MPTRSKPLKFADLHCGIGSLRLAIEGCGAECVWSYTADAQSALCYRENFGGGTFGSSAGIPAHDILLANLDEHRGAIRPRASGRHPYETILDVICLRRPPACLLAKADGVSAASRPALIDDLLRLGYFVHRAKLDARRFGLPQAVTTDFLVAFDRETGYRLPTRRGRMSSLDSLLDPKPHGRYYLSERDRDKLIARRGRSVNNGSKWRMGFVADGCANALSDAPDALYGNIVIESDGRWRVLTEREAARLQGIPDSFVLHADRHTARKQVARCIPVPVAAAVAERIVAEFRPSFDARKARASVKGIGKGSRGRKPRRVRPDGKPGATNDPGATLRWYGSSNGHASRIVKLFPGHKFYCEVFGGSGAILLSKPPSRIETFNDIDEKLVRFWRVLREPRLRKRLIERIEVTSSSPVEFRERLAGRDADDDLVAGAWAFVVACNHRRNGCAANESDWSGNKNEGGNRNVWATLPARVAEVGRRLKRVQVERRASEDILRRYDLHDTLFLLDPPFLPETRESAVRFTHECGRDDHIRLLRIARGLEAKVALCGYRNDLYDGLLGDWHRTDIKGKSPAGPRARGRGVPSGVLSLYTNYEPPSR